MGNPLKKIIPKLSLVGAGPGDSELITIKGLKTLAEADVIMYDALVNTELLNFTKKVAKRIFVGKRSNSLVYTQEEINRLIVENAFEYGHVVRLKGGDPFIFGRGHEELEYVQSFNIKVEVIPGVSSFYAVPGLQRIPLTKRGLNESFWVITGTTSNGGISEDIYKAAETDATIVILMGMQKLKEISEIFMRSGKAELPAAIIQNGSLPDEKIGICRVENLEETAVQKKLSSPAVIVIGEVVNLHPEAAARLNPEAEQKFNHI